MEDRLIKVVAQIREKDGEFVSCRQLPTFFVVGNCLGTGIKVAKEMFIDKNITGQVMFNDDSGRFYNFD
jgi:hypothetical protein